MHPFVKVGLAILPVGALVGTALWWNSAPAPEPAVPSPTITAAPVVIDPVVKETAPATSTPEQEPVAPPAEPLPEPESTLGIASGESWLREQVEHHSTALLPYLVDDELLRKGVMLVSALSEGRLPLQHRPLQSQITAFSGLPKDEEHYWIDPRNYERLSPLIQAFTRIPPETTLTIYSRLREACQDAYQELGQRGRFDDQLHQVLQRIVEADLPEQSPELIRPSVYYRYADPRLERLGALEKLLLRLGPQHRHQLQQYAQAMLDGWPAY